MSNAAVTAVQPPAYPRTLAIPGVWPRVEVDLQRAAAIDALARGEWTVEEWQARMREIAGHAGGY